ncbi:MAG TPA: hypothetical protein VNW15_06265 [Rhizomicrobium sp.]|jgi:hypothetical protein|nr:hypothetical protein [Rhizomicrobium sp.]
MLRIFSVLAVLAVLVGVSLGFAGWPHASAAASRPNDDRMMRAYALVKAGMPVSQLGVLGLDTAKAEKLSKLALIERYMPKDSTAFDALNPAVKNCYLGPDDCTAYFFEGYANQAVLLVQGGVVTWKDVFDVSVVDAGRVERVARN